jgi:putative methyltransferase (TIGR04325 family)
LIKQFIKAWVPPAIVEMYRGRTQSGIYFKGSFPDWQSAAEQSEGYDSKRILELVAGATRQVISGEAAGERDSVLFETPPYPFPVIAALLRAAMENECRLTVLDFGGALGSSYHQCKNFLGKLEFLSWNIVEQPHYVLTGKAEFETDSLRFHESIRGACQEFQPDVVLASGVLQYVPDALGVVDSFISTGAEYVIIDRTPFSLSGSDIISTQLVPKAIGVSSYPLRLFNEELLKDRLLNKYDEIASFPALDGVIGRGALKAAFKGFIFKKKQCKERV